MSDYELIMLILEVITVVIAFGAVTSNWITERPFHQLFIVLR
ncbi:hypothetical protein [Veillonella parvula]|nr:hypothetical protein [Veillonella parvula]MDU2260820.1 hypothetical protein [Veillonella parvula]